MQTPPPAYRAVLDLYEDHRADCLIPLDSRTGAPTCDECRRLLDDAARAVAEDAYREIENS